MTRITAEEIAELRAKLVGFAGPWLYSHKRLSVDTAQLVGDGIVYDLNHWCTNLDNDEAAAEGALIVAAVNALPRLLDRIEELEADAENRRRCDKMVWGKVDRERCGLPAGHHGSCWRSE